MYLKNPSKIGIPKKEEDRIWLWSFEGLLVMLIQIEKRTIAVHSQVIIMLLDYFVLFSEMRHFDLFLEPSRIPQLESIYIYITQNEKCQK